MTASRGSAPETSPRRAADPRRLLLVTGLSGAGHSSALKALEDMGYEAVDNLPLFLLGGLMENPEMLARPIAIGVDSRTRDFSVAALSEQLRRGCGRAAGIEVRLLFLIARRHPAAPLHGNPPPPSAGVRPACHRRHRAGTRAAGAAASPRRCRHRYQRAAPRRSQADPARSLRGRTTAGGAVGDLLLLPRRPAAGSRPRVRCALPAQSRTTIRNVPARSPGATPPVADFIEADPAFAPFFASLRRSWRRCCRP